MAETLFTDCGAYGNGAVLWKYGGTSGDHVPCADNIIQDLLRGVGMSLTGTATTPAPARALVNQLLPVGLLMVQTVPAADNASFTTRRTIGGTFVNTSRISGAQVAGTIPAGALNILGRTLEIEAWGTLGTTGTPNLTVDIGLGASAVLATTGVLALTAVTSPMPWVLKCWSTVTTAGSSGVMNSAGSFVYGTSSNAVTVAFGMANSTPGTGLSIDLTTAGGFTFNVFATCGTSDPANRIQMNGCVVKVIG